MSLDIRNKKKKDFISLRKMKKFRKSSENINPQAVRRIREYVELNYGKSYLSESEQARVNRKFLYRNPQKLYPVSYRWNFTEPCDKK